MILASAVRQVRGLGDNKFEVVTSLRTFIFRAEREGTTSASFTFSLLHFAAIYQLLVLFSCSVCLCRSDCLISCLALFFSLVLSVLPSPPPPSSLSVCLISHSYLTLSKCGNLLPHLFPPFLSLLMQFTLPFISQRTFFQCDWMFYIIQNHFASYPYVQKVENSSKF